MTTTLSKLEIGQSLPRNKKISSYTKMRAVSAILLCATIGSASAFVVGPSTTKMMKVESSSSSLEMGLFDFFSEEARQKREAKRRREIEEQERLQKAIMERRKNPEKMEEYENKVLLRRQLRMAGDDEAAEKIAVYDDDVDSNSLLDGTNGKA